MVAPWYRGSNHDVTMTRIARSHTDVLNNRSHIVRVCDPAVTLDVIIMKQYIAVFYGHFLSSMGGYERILYSKVYMDLFP